MPGFYEVLQSACSVMRVTGCAAGERCATHHDGAYRMCHPLNFWGCMQAARFRGPLTRGLG